MGFKGGEYTGSGLRGRKFPIEVLTREEAVALLETCSRRAPTGIRDRALIVLMWRGGLRIAEAMALRPGDVDDRTGDVTVQLGKGSKRRVVRLDSAALTEVLRWKDQRRALGLRGRTLICTLQGRPVSVQHVRAMLARRAEKAGIEHRVNPHALRHTFATELAREGVPLPHIQAALGHSTLAATEKYLHHLHPAETLEVLGSRAPGW